jgi:ribosomal protein S18 acetylase RimI-like enzyme
MAIIARLERARGTGLRHGTAPTRMVSRREQGWVLRRAQRSDAAAVTALFWKLHAFNASLDSRFALAEDWEAHFAPMLDQALGGRGVLCLIARERHTGEPAGFALAAIHWDSSLWRHHEWVEVEALYVEEKWRGQALAAELLARACRWADAMGQPVIQLYVTASNARALRFYQREGFHQTQVILRRLLTGKSSQTSRQL